MGTGAGFAMVFALLIAAIIWNLGTWYLGLPASSSHTLIGSIIGVGIANALMHGQDGTSGVDWTKATEIGYSLLLSPLVRLRRGGAAAAGAEVRGAQSGSLSGAQGQSAAALVDPRYADRSPARACRFAHGSNDGQKGMGLIMLILIGTVPDGLCAQPGDAGQSRWKTSATTSAAAAEIVEQQGGRLQHHRRNPRPAVSVYVSRAQDRARAPIRRWPRLIAGDLEADIGVRLDRRVPAEAVGNTRNDMYLASEAIRFLLKDKENDLSKDEVAKLGAYKKSLDGATKFIPLWVKVAVAIALGLGTMIGWKRIVITVGEKIGKTPYDLRARAPAPKWLPPERSRPPTCYGLPVSTTHVLSSGVAGTMAANGSGLQMGHGAQPADGLGPDAARGHHAFGVPLRTLRQSALRCPRRFRAITSGNVSTA